MNNPSKNITVLVMCLQPVGGGLSVESARELGLQPGIPVGTSLIDAHAGSMYENEQYSDWYFSVLGNGRLQYV